MSTVKDVVFSALEQNASATPDYIARKYNLNFSTVKTYYYQWRKEQEQIPTFSLEFVRDGSKYQIEIENEVIAEQYAKIEKMKEDIAYMRNLIDQQNAVIRRKHETIQQLHKKLGAKGINPAPKTEQVSVALAA